MKATTSDQTSEGRTPTNNPAASASLGAQLRRAREERGIRLREISEQTRISLRYLEAIEIDEYKQLPGGIFNRSFIKSYARYVGLNEAEAVEAYNRIAREHGESPDEPQLPPQRARVYDDGHSSRSPLVTGVLTVLVLAILSLGVYAALRGYQRRANRNNEDASATKAPIANSQNTGGQATTAAPSAVAPASLASAPPLKVELTAKGEKLWLRVRADQDQTEITLPPNDPKEYTPQDGITLWYPKSRAKSLEVKINGRAAKVPTEVQGKSSLVEMNITKADYTSLLQ